MNRGRNKNAVCISLIAHTNVGKTTLCRTLLRKDVGIVADRPNVTQAAEAWPLVELESDVLLLWDTPGFGDSHRLVRRLRDQAKPIAWLMREVWDRTTNTPWYDAQTAARNAKEEAHVVLYLVDGRLDPAQTAAYAASEMELLQWIDCPVVLVVNQTGPYASAWRSFAHQWPIIKDCLSLDAHTRCWVQEAILMMRLAQAVRTEQRDAMTRLGEAWIGQLLSVHHQSARRIAAYLAEVAADTEPLLSSRVPGRAGNKALANLKGRLAIATERLGHDLIQLHGLEGNASARVQAELADVRKPPEINRPLWTVASSAAGGLALGATTSLVAGGLDFGGGAAIGLVGGALSGWLLAQGVEKLTGLAEPVARWSDSYLDALFVNACERYLRVAHAGRGKGEFRDEHQRAAWSQSLERAAAEARGEARRGWSDRKAIAAGPIAAAVDSTLRKVLLEHYPDSRSVWELDERKT